MMEDEKKRKEKDFRTQLMMLDIDGVLNQHQPDTEQMMTAAQAIATSAIGQMVNQGVNADALHRFADMAAEQIGKALHQRIAEGRKPDWGRWMRAYPQPLPERRGDKYDG